MTDARLATLYAETLVAGTPATRAAAVYAETVAAGSPEVQVATVYAETVARATTAAVASEVYAETLAHATTAVVLRGVYAESLLANATTAAILAAVYLEALDSLTPPIVPGEHTVTVGGVDVSCLVDTVTINHGRGDSTGQPEASSATIELSTYAETDLPPAVEVGALVAVSTMDSAGPVERFAGRVTDLALGWDEAGLDTPDRGLGQLVAVGSLADLGRRVVGEEPWPQELDGARVARALAAAGVFLDPTTSDPGTVEVLPRDVDSTTALDAAHSTAVSANGLLWETRAGEIRYADADHRRGVVPTLTLDACDLLVTPTWRRTIEGLANEVSIGYGVAPDGGEQPRYIDTAPDSVAQWGRYGYTASTELADLVDAERVGRLLLARNSSPVWVMAALPVDVAGLDPARLDALLALDVHDLVTLTGLPTLGHAPTSAVLWVEGWRETLAYRSHEIELVVSGYCRTAPPPQWDEVPPSWEWDTVDPALSWDAVACLGPPVDFGRWDDQPATLRWDGIDPALSWDTYT